MRLKLGRRILAYIDPLGVLLVALYGMCCGCSSLFMMLIVKGLVIAVLEAFFRYDYAAIIDTSKLRDRGFGHLFRILGRLIIFPQAEQLECSVQTLLKRSMLKKAPA
jgi:hypothetical protein